MNKSPERKALDGEIDAEEYMRLSEEQDGGHREVTESNRQKVRDANRLRWQTVRGLQ